MGGISYSYDSNGNMTAREAQTLAWDVENRLASVTQGGSTATFAYAGEGQRWGFDTVLRRTT